MPADLRTRRDPLTRAAQWLRARNETPVDVFPTRSWGHGTSNGVAPSQDMVAQMRAMLDVSTLFAVIDRLATSIAAVDWHLYREFEPGTPVEDRTVVSEHPALSVWNQPNPFYSQRQFVETIIQHYDLTGEWWWLIGRMNGAPQGSVLELWPIRPDRMRPVPDPKRFISGYSYVGGGVPVPLSTTDAVWTRRPNPLDPYRGLAPVGSLIFDLGGEKAAAQWNAQFFVNSARPDGIIEVPDTLDQTEFDDMIRHWRESHQGTSNAHRVGVLERGVYKNAGYSQKDMDFVGLRGFTKEQILEAYAMPKFMLGKVEGVQRATANASKAVFAELSMNPRLDLIRECLNSQLLPLFGTSGRGVMFDYDDPIPPDAETDRADLAAKIAAVQAMAGLGADPAEACEVFGLPVMSFDQPAAPVSSPPIAPAEEGDEDDGSEFS